MAEHNKNRTCSLFLAASRGYTTSVIHITGDSMYGTCIMELAINSDKHFVYYLMFQILLKLLKYKLVFRHSINLYSNY